MMMKVLLVSLFLLVALVHAQKNKDNKNNKGSSSNNGSSNSNGLGPVKSQRCKNNANNKKKCEFPVADLRLGDRNVDEIELDLKGDGNTIVCKRQDYTANGLAWHGKCGLEAGDANFVRRKSRQGNERVYGSVHMGDEICSFSPNADGVDEVQCEPQSSYMEELPPHRASDNNGKGNNKKTRRSLLRSQESNATSSMTGDLMYGMTAEARNTRRRLFDDTGTTLDIMVVWTLEAECLYSGLEEVCTVSESTEDNMLGLIDLAIEESNTAFTLSGINTQLRLVHAYRDVNYVEENVNTFDAAVDDLRNNGDGKLDDVHEKRALYGADLVAMIVGGGAYCGIAYLGPSVDSMFSVTHFECATGYYSFVHEIAHNLGSFHDRGTSDACDATGYNYGWRDTAANFRTIMAYNCVTGQCDGMPSNGCNRIQRFSTPDFQFGGRALGDASNDNARHINERLAAVAGYFPAMNCEQDSDCDDGKAGTVDTCNIDNRVCVFTATPTPSPTMAAPSSVPTMSHSASPSASPSRNPSLTPSKFPSESPSRTPSRLPSASPSTAPSTLPSISPSNSPSTSPSNSPSASPSSAPSNVPSALPTSKPSQTPSSAPSSVPSPLPTVSPSKSPSTSPSRAPTKQPTTHAPVATRAGPLPTAMPSSKPSGKPSSTPSSQPSQVPSASPSGQPSHVPSASPSATPSQKPSGISTLRPSASPTSIPSPFPTSKPSNSPSASPSRIPTALPSKSPSKSPSRVPTGTPSSSPVAAPSAIPTAAPVKATDSPTEAPTSTSGPVPRLEFLVTEAVNSAIWTTVSLQNHYTDPIAVCTVDYGGKPNMIPAVVRMQNVRASSFQIKLQNPSGKEVPSSAVHCIVVEKGAWVLPDGRHIEAQSYVSTRTDHQQRMTGERQFYQHNYRRDPALFGQVMSFNDSRFSVFWSSGRLPHHMANSRFLVTGKHVGKDKDIARANEVVGFIAIEENHAISNKVEISSFSGPRQAVSYTRAVERRSYRLRRPFRSSPPKVIVISQAAQSGGEASWAVLDGSFTKGSFNVAIDEDEIGGSRDHKWMEPLDYIAFSNEGSIELLLEKPERKKPQQSNKSEKSSKSGEHDIKPRPTRPGLPFP